MRPLWVKYDPSAFLNGTAFLDPMDELVYRRFCDLVYESGGPLDDTPSLAMQTKARDQWEAIRDRLIGLGKIVRLDDGRLANRRCLEVLEAANEKREQARNAANTRHGRNTDAMRPHNDRNATGHAEEKRREENRNIPTAESVAREAASDFRPGEGPASKIDGLTRAHMKIAYPYLADELDAYLARADMIILQSPSATPVMRRINGFLEKENARVKNEEAQKPKRKLTGNPEMDDPAYDAIL